MKANKLIEEVCNGKNADTLVESLHQLSETPKEWTETLKSKSCRIQWSTQGRNWMTVEELPSKPMKRRLRRANVRTEWFQNLHDSSNPTSGYWDLYLPTNIMMDVQKSIGTDFTYDQVLAAVRQHMEELKQKAIDTGVKVNDGKGWKPVDEDWFKRIGYGHMVSESDINYQEVEPDETGEIICEGKNFKVTCSWNKFSAYDPDSDFQSMDPTYTVYNSASPTSARKLYQILQKDPNALKEVSWSQFKDWAKTRGIRTETNFSQWH